MLAEEYKGHLAAFFTVFLWGTTFISTKVLLIDFLPVEILFVRFCMGWFILFLLSPHSRVHKNSFLIKNLFLPGRVLPAYVFIFCWKILP